MEETTNPVEGDALPSAEVRNEDSEFGESARTSSARVEAEQSGEPMLDPSTGSGQAEFGNPLEEEPDEERFEEIERNGKKATIAMPAGIRFAHSVAYSGEALQKVPLPEIQHRTETGVPSCWAQSGGAIRLWPIPNAAFAISVHGLASTDVPASDGESNIWTSEAYHLIVARSKVTLFRMFKEFDAMQAAQAEEAEALSRLRSETRRRGASPLRCDPSTRSGQAFNVNRGW